MKYGDILGGFKKGVQEHSDSKSNWKDLTKELEKTRKAIEKSTVEEKRLEDTNRKLLAERQRLLAESKNVAKGSAKGKEIAKKLADNSKQYSSNAKRLNSSVQSSSQAKKDIPELAEQLNEAKGFKGLAKNMGSTAAETEVLGTSVGEFLGAIEAGPAALVAVGATIMAEVTKMTYDMMKENNEAMISLERSTGGLVSASKLGANQFGKLEGSIQTVGDVTRRANVSMEQFGEAMGAFFSGGGGHTIGTSDLANRKTALMDLGIWGARIKKLYSADIIPAIRTLFQNWGEDGIMSLTDIMHDGVMQAKAEGLDPEQFAKNMDDVAKMSGRLNFKGGVKGMKEMALYATKMGVSVEDVASGFTEMGSFTDIFEKQASMAAMGFNHLGASLGKVYGQRLQGDYTGAYQTEKEGALQDVMSRGLVDEKGNIKNEGIQNLQGLGWKQEQITALQQSAIAVKKFHASIKEAVKPLQYWRTVVPCLFSVHVRVFRFPQVL